jgi:prepilin-type N-terminal cleavage/methylation domain-containing protein
MKRYTKGFTFIELMVAISIIGVLMLIVFSGVANTRKSARVAQRVSDMKKVQSALDLYYANNKSYPSTGGLWRGACSSYNGSGAYTANNGLVIPGLAPTYLIKIPTDPQSSDPDHCYLYNSNGTDYAFLVHNITELSSGPGATYAKYPELYDPTRPTWAWKVSSPGGVGW